MDRGRLVLSARMKTEELLVQYGYLGVALGVAFEGEAVLVMGGVLAHEGLLRLPIVMLVAFVATFAVDQAWFAVGRKRGKAFVASRPALARRAVFVERKIGRWGDAYVLAFRFLYGLRTISPIVLGTSSYAHVRFVVLNGVGAAIWSFAFGGAGWAFGSTLERVLGRAHHVEELMLRAALVLVPLLVVISLVARRLRQRR